MDTDVPLFVIILCLIFYIMFCWNEIYDLEKEIEQIKETNIVCEVEKNEND